ncbi:MAG TPA: phosphatase PAP2 family protein, partial [Steroidobacteraceae bacterium]|nr:phosphatase PAP2 family protein [Steroidobacteraceae bacterium]
MRVLEFASGAATDMRFSCVRAVLGLSACHQASGPFIGRRSECGVRDLRVTCGVLLWGLLAGTAFSQQALTDHQRRVERAGTALMFALPAAALAATWALEPREVAGAPDNPHWLLMGGTPRHDLLLALARAGVTTGALKYAVNETRPNGDPNSFPSGHATAAFTGAEFLRKEYGWGWGAPAYVAASFVAWSRVKADKHYTHDVLAGAAIGILANHDFWRRDTSAGRLSVGAGPVVSSGRF